MKKQELIEKLKASQIESIQTWMPVSEVVRLLEEVEDETNEFGGFNIVDMASRIAEEVDEYVNDIDNVADYDLCMSFREVELDSIEYNMDGIQDLIESEIKKYISQ
jgi:hypothetical protein